MEALHAKNKNADVLNKIHDEKDKVVPNCKLCASRCGNSDDVLPEIPKGSYKEKVFLRAMQSENVELVIEALARIASNQDEEMYQWMYEKMKGKE